MSTCCMGTASVQLPAHQALILLEVKLEALRALVCRCKGQSHAEPRL